MDDYLPDHISRAHAARSRYPEWEWKTRMEVLEKENKRLRQLLRHWMEDEIIERELKK